MPRLTNTDYLRIRSILRTNWLDERASLFQLLTATEQWGLHAFYAPTRDNTDAQALEHRKAISREKPSLPQRAGKALRRIERVALHSPADTLIPELASAKRVVRVYAVVRPEPDLDKLAQVLLEMAATGVENLH